MVFCALHSVQLLRCLQSSVHRSLAFRDWHHATTHTRKLYEVCVTEICSQTEALTLAVPTNIERASSIGGRAAAWWWGQQTAIVVVCRSRLFLSLPSCSSFARLSVSRQGSGNTYRCPAGRNPELRPPISRKAPQSSSRSMILNASERDPGGQKPCQQRKPPPRRSQATR
jgi:hypothetical protein